MKSGLEDRNNSLPPRSGFHHGTGLNEVRPGRPEQSYCTPDGDIRIGRVSMKSGLEDRNNEGQQPRGWIQLLVSMKSGLEDRNNFYAHPNGAQPDSVSMKSGLEDRNNRAVVLGGVPVGQRLNEVRPGRPEQSPAFHSFHAHQYCVSMKSGLEDRNNILHRLVQDGMIRVSMKSGLEDRNNCSCAV